MVETKEPTTIDALRLLALPTVAILIAIGRALQLESVYKGVSPMVPKAMQDPTGLLWSAETNSARGGVDLWSKRSVFDGNPAYEEAHAQAVRAARLRVAREEGYGTNPEGVDKIPIEKITDSPEVRAVKDDRVVRYFIPAAELVTIAVRAEKLS